MSTSECASNATALTSAKVIEDAKTIVIKIGSALVCDIDNATLRQDWLNSFAADVQALHSAGKEIIIVSSGGVAMGRTALKISPTTPPSSIPLEKKQAASAIGQPYVFQGYSKAFATQNIDLAQVLLTISETENRRMHLNARETLYTLLDNKIIPIINENDTISTGELRFGDNDRLAARVAQMMNADAVILLSTIDGLYSKNPHSFLDAKHIPLITAIDDRHLKMAGDAIAGLSTGGMKSKLSAAQAATRAGISLIISNGQGENPLKLIKTAKTTLFSAQKTSAKSRKKWIASHLSPKGSIFIDNGALNALKSGKSLLPVGVKRVEGQFERGDIVIVFNEDNEEVGKGIVAYSSEDTQSFLGQSKEHIHTLQGYIGRDELIHRNDLALLV